MPDCSETSSKSVPWISVEMPTSDFRSASLDAAYTILGRILAPSGVLRTSAGRVMEGDGYGGETQAEGRPKGERRGVTTRREAYGDKGGSRRRGQLYVDKQEGRES